MDEIIQRTRRFYTDSNVTPVFITLLGLTSVVICSGYGLEILIAAGIILFCKPLCCWFIKRYVRKDLNCKDTKKLKKKVFENVAIHKGFPKLVSGNAAHIRSHFIPVDKRFYQSCATKNKIYDPLSLALKRRSHGIHNVYSSESQWGESNSIDKPHSKPLSGGMMEFCRQKTMGLANVESDMPFVQQTPFQQLQEDLMSKRLIKEMSPSARLRLLVAGSNHPLVLDYDDRWYEAKHRLSGSSGNRRPGGTMGYFHMFVSRNTGYVKRSLGLEPTWHLLRNRIRRRKRLDSTTKGFKWRNAGTVPCVRLTTPARRQLSERNTTMMTLIRPHFVRASKWCSGVWCNPCLDQMQFKGTKNDGGKDRGKQEEKPAKNIRKRSSDGEQHFHGHLATQNKRRYIETSRSDMAPIQPEYQGRPLSKVRNNSIFSSLSSSQGRQADQANRVDPDQAAPKGVKRHFYQTQRQKPTSSIGGKENLHPTLIPQPDEDIQTSFELIDDIPPAKRRYDLKQRSSMQAILMPDQKNSNQKTPSVLWEDLPVSPEKKNNEDKSNSKSTATVSLGTSPKQLSSSIHTMQKEACEPGISTTTSVEDTSSELSTIASQPASGLKDVVSFSALMDNNGLLHGNNSDFDTMSTGTNDEVLENTLHVPPTTTSDITTVSGVVSASPSENLTVSAVVSTSLNSSSRTGVRWFEFSSSANDTDTANTNAATVNTSKPDILESTLRSEKLAFTVLSTSAKSAVEFENDTVSTLLLSPDTSSHTASVSDMSSPPLVFGTNMLHSEASDRDNVPRPVTPQALSPNANLRELIPTCSIPKPPYSEQSEVCISQIRSEGELSPSQNSGPIETPEQRRLTVFVTPKQGTNTVTKEQTELLRLAKRENNTSFISPSYIQPSTPLQLPVYESKASTSSGHGKIENAMQPTEQTIKSNFITEAPSSQLFHSMYQSSEDVSSRTGELPGLKTSADISPEAVAPELEPVDIAPSTQYADQTKTQGFAAGFSNVVDLDTATTTPKETAKTKPLTFTASALSPSYSAASSDVNTAAFINSTSLPVSTARRSVILASSLPPTHQDTYHLSPSHAQDKVMPPAEPVTAKFLPGKAPVGSSDPPIILQTAIPKSSVSPGVPSVSLKLPVSPKKPFSPEGSSVSLKLPSVSPMGPSVSLKVQSVSSSKSPKKIPKPAVDTNIIPTPPAAPLYERLPDGQYTFIVFDLETTGFGAADIVQFAAKCGDRTFNEYVLPDKKISEGASEVTGITTKNGKLYKDGKELPSTLIDHCLQQFEHWMHGYVNPVLVAHNCFTYDSYVLTRQILKWWPSLKTKIAGFVDTLPLFKETFPGKTSYKQESLLKEEGILHGAHCALEDVKALDILIIRKNVDENLMLRHSRKTEGVVQYTKKREAKASVKSSLYPLLDEKVLTDGMINKLADTGLTLGHLQTAFKKDKKTGIRGLLSDEVDGKPRVTKTERVIKAIEEYLASLELK